MPDSTIRSAPDGIDALLAPTRVTGRHSGYDLAAAPLPAFTGSLMAMRVMPCLTMKLSAMFGWMLAARRQPTAISLTEIIPMIDAPIEVLRAVGPGPRTDEDTAGEPLWAVVAIGSAVARWSLVVSVRTNRRWSDSDRHLCGRVMGVSHPPTLPWRTFSASGRASHE